MIVGPKSALETEEFRIRDVNWLGNELAEGVPMDVMIKWRSVQPQREASITYLGAGEAQVTLVKSEAAVAPGQACVVYDNNKVLGGGWIVRHAIGA